MHPQLLQIVRELAGIQERLLSLLVSEELSIPEDLSIPEEPAAPAAEQEPTPPVAIPKEARCTFLKKGMGAPPAVLEGIRAAGFTLDDVAGGVAFRKDHYSREGAWATARPVWNWLRAGEYVPFAPYNTLRKAHTKNWYIWVHDPNMEKKLWVRDRIRDRE
jgi:hypothetical protein